MANLRVDKITSTETFETTGSVQFDGTTDFLSLSSNTDFAMGTGDFTAECWVYVVSDTYAEGGYGQRVFDSNTGQLGIYINSDGTGGYVGALVSGADIRPTVAHGIAAEGTWTHAAICRSGDDFRIFVNGREAAYRSGTGSVASSANFRIGARANGNGGFKGHISNLRVIKGKALYTANFKPSMRELEVIPGTVLLACQSKTDATLEKTGKTIAVTGNAVASELTPGILTPVPKAGAGSAITGSVGFSGGTTSNPGDYLSVPNTTDLRLGSSDFTVEAYVNFTNGAVSNGVIVSLWDNTNNQRSWNLYFDTSNGLYFAGSTNGSSGNNNVNVSIDIEDGEWYHVAACRSGSTIKLFVNGVERASNTSVGTYYDNTTDLVTIGAQNHDNPVNYWKGFISNLRIVKGTALYTDDFIPPTRELKRVPGTVLLCCQDPDNPLTEATGKTITGHGSLGDGSLGPELVTNDSVWTLTKGGSGATDWTVSNSGSSLAGTTVSGGYIRATYTIPKGDYLVSLRWTGGAFAVQDSTGYIVATDGTDTEFGASEDGAYSFYMTATTSVVITGTSWSTAYTVDDISIKRIYKNNGASNFTPQVGDNRKVTFEGVTKVNSDAYFYLPTGDTASREATGTYNAGTRGIFGAIGVYPNSSVTIHYSTIATFGNTVDFGDLNESRRYAAGCSSKIRGLFGGGAEAAPGPAKRDSIDYITIATTGNANDFGDLTTARWAPSAFSNATRGIWFSGNTSPANTNVIDYVTIASTGNASDFGDTFSSRRYCLGSTSDTTRGIDAGGHPASKNVIQYVTIASAGNAQDFGDLMQESQGGCGGVSNGTRGVFAGGYTPTQINTIQYITIQSMGNSKDFGDMTSTDARHGAAAESSTRGLFTHGGYPSRLNTIDAITIATTGNAVEFGDIIDIGGNDGGGDSGTQSGFSNGHGGLG